MLYLIATPIGNLTDITFRAVSTLQSCDYILCEDTRHSQILLQHYNIHKPLKSYHKFNEASQSDSILADLEEGKNIALISDAGTPGISDPGEDLVKKCIEKGLTVTAIPGPCAAVQALSCSGLSTERFQFWGFMPRKEGEIRRALQEILTYKGTTICYESPHRLVEMLEFIHQMDPERPIVVARELTKKFEEIIRGKSMDLIEYWKTNPLKGEIVLLISGAKDDFMHWENLPPLEHVQHLQDTFGLTKTESIKIAAELRGVPKRQLYNDLIGKEET